MSRRVCARLRSRSRSLSLSRERARERESCEGGGNSASLCTPLYTLQVTLRESVPATFATLSLSLSTPLYTLQLTEKHPSTQRTLYLILVPYAPILVAEGGIDYSGSAIGERNGACLSAMREGSSNASPLTSRCLPPSLPPSLALLSSGTLYNASPLTSRCLPPPLPPSLALLSSGSLYNASPLTNTYPI